MILKVFDKSTVAEWKNIVQKFPEKYLDIYYWPEYLLSWEKYENAEAKCLYVRHNDTEFLYPFLKKQITEFDLDQSYYDIQSAYGYAGIIANNYYISDTVVNEVNTLIDDWCLEKNVIAEFIRLDPLQKENLRNCKRIPVRFNAISDLKNIEFHKDATRGIKHAIKKGVSIEIDEALSTIDDFYKLYQLSANQLKMDSYYFFDTKYFDEIKRNMAGNCAIINAFYENQHISALMLVFANKKCHGHLAASNLKYRKLKFNNLAYEASVSFAKEKGLQLFSFGGGLTYSKNDSLLNFKSKFANQIIEVFIGTKVHNEAIYSQLQNTWKQMFPNLVKEHGNKFLNYRYTN